MSKIKLKNLDYSDFYLGGIVGISRLISFYNFYPSENLILNQISETDEFTYTLDDVQPHMVQRSIDSVIVEKSINIEEISFPYQIPLFSDKPRLVEALIYVNSSSISDNEKLDLFVLFGKDFQFKRSCIDEIGYVFDEQLCSVIHELDRYLNNLSIEIELRKKELRLALEMLDVAIKNNEEVIQLSDKKHLVSCASLMNKTFIWHRDVLTHDFKEYLPSMNSLVFDSKEISRISKKEALIKLLDGLENIQKFQSCEEALVSRGYLNSTRDKWQRGSQDLIRFYCQCEKKGLFKYQYKDKTKGVKLLREMYNYNEGTSIDMPNKRKKQSLYAPKDYYFLPI